MTLVDIIIPVFGMPELVMKCLQSIPEAAKKVSYDVIIVDNGSKPAEIDQYSKVGKELFGNGFHVINTHQNAGFASTCNRGARFGGSPLLFFLNDDVVLFPDAIDKLAINMDDPKVGAVGMKLLFPKESTDPNRPAGKVQHVGISTNIRAQFFHNFVGWNPDNPRVLRIKESYAITGAAMMTRRSIFRDAKGFLEDYGFGTYEDVDYCLTIREMGYNIKIEQEAIGEHFTGATAMAHQTPFPIENNRMLLMQRWANRLAYTEWEVW